MNDLELNQLGLQHHQKGQYDRATHYYHQALKKNRRNADSWHLLGVVSLQKCDYKEAETLIQRAIIISPNESHYHNHLGLVYRGKGDLNKAVEAYRHSLALAPNQTDSLNNLGVLFLEQKEYPEAEKQFRQALLLEPNHALSLMNLGNTLQAQKRFSEAVEQYIYALEFDPTSPTLLKNLAAAYRNLGQLDKVGETLAKISFEDIEQPEIWLERASYLSQIQEYDQAEEILRVLIDNGACLTEACFQLGLIRQSQKRFPEAISLYTQVLERDSQNANIWNNLGLALTQQGLIPEAIGIFERAISINPDFAAAQHNRLYTLNLDPQKSVADVFEAHRSWGVSQLEKVTPRTEWKNSKEPNRKLRIGYVSPDFRYHAVASFLKPVFHNHSDLFEITAYSETRCTDDVTKEIQANVSHWRHTIGLSANDLAKQIEADEIDILIDLAGHTANNRLDIFALKPAPVQMTYLGYGNTTGLPTIDYMISNGFYHPLDGTGPASVEKIARLTGNLVCYTPLQNGIEVNALPALKNGGVTFGSLHNLNKITPDVIELWSEVLHKVEGSKLLIFRDNLNDVYREKILNQFAIHEIDSARIICESKMPPEGHLGIYHQIDISLDVFPFGSGTTAYESCWMGVPMLTKCGPSMLERGAGSLLYHLELFDWITCSESGFVEMATELTQNLAQLAEVRATLRGKMLKSICDAQQFTLGLEKLYRDAWSEWCNR